jgi:glucose dehydrogenase
MGGPTADWPSYGGDAGGTRYLLLTQIDKSNVAQLKVAWEYHTGDVSIRRSTCTRRIPKV